MKLIMCKKCDDIVSIHSINKIERRCLCGASGGAYTDEVQAYYFGEHCVPLFMSNTSLDIAFKEYNSNPEAYANLDLAVYISTGIVSSKSKTFIKLEKS